MAIEKLPSGTRGTSNGPAVIGRIMMPIMRRIHRLTGNRFQGMDLVYLSTVGARSGQPRSSHMARFDGGEGRWIIVASANGAAQHPAWYHNIVAHPDQVWAEVNGTRHHVRVEQLSGEEREQAWATVVASAPRFAGYTQKTDRPLPVLRLTPLD
jgi:deazaflavin-dependent oxidoreductase (nitroreductase family)